MCGRATLTTPIDEIAEQLGVDALPLGPVGAPRYNIAPGQPLVVLRGGELALLKWGLLPSWGKKPLKPFIQARAETVATAPPFRDAFASRRCLVVVDGFYEWSSPPEGKRQPHHVHRPGGGIFLMAGLWERDTCAVVTTEARGAVRAIHDRMPVVVAAEDRDAWLRGSADDAKAVLARGDAELALEPVSMRVNDVKNDDPGCLAPAATDSLDVERQIALPFR